MDHAQTGLADNGWPKGFTVVGKAFHRFMLQDNRKAEKIAQPFSRGGQIIQLKLLRRLAIGPEADFPEFRVERRAQFVDAGRAFAVHDFSVRIINCENAVVLQNAAGGKAGGFERNTVERLDREYNDSAELHPGRKQYCNRSLRGKLFFKNFQ